MDLKLSGKRALVSGSTAGIGLAIATALANEGARVIVNGRALASVDEVVARLQSGSGGEVAGFAGDLSQAAVAEALARRHPDIEILVNNLGISSRNVRGDHRRRLGEILRGQCAERGAAGAAAPARDEGRQLGPHHLHFQRKRGADSGGNDPLRHDQDGAACGLARVGRERCRHRHHRQQHPARADQVARRRRFCRCLARSEGKSFAEFEQEFFEKVRPTSLIRRFATSEEVASLVAYIASPLASATTGAALRVDGGVIKSAF